MTITKRSIEDVLYRWIFQTKTAEQYDAFKFEIEWKDSLHFRRVDLPHTWNSIDGQDGGNDYWRGTCVYEKTRSKPDLGADPQVYLEFQGVNASAKVGFNGAKVGTHDGGRSTFRWDVTDFLQRKNSSLKGRGSM